VFTLEEIHLMLLSEADTPRYIPAVGPQGDLIHLEEIAGVLKNNIIKEKSQRHYASGSFFLHFIEVCFSVSRILTPERIDLTTLLLLYCTQAQVSARRARLNIRSIT
jgi:hypothetical protein